MNRNKNQTISIFVNIFFFPFCNICSDEKIFVAVNVNICRMWCCHINNDLPNESYSKNKHFFLFPTQIIDGVPNDGY